MEIFGTTVSQEMVICGAQDMVIYAALEMGTSDEQEMEIHVAWVNVICIVQETWIFGVQVIATYVETETETCALEESAIYGAQVRVIEDVSVMWIFA